MGRMSEDAERVYGRHDHDGGRCFGFLLDVRCLVMFLSRLPCLVMSPAATAALRVSGGVVFGLFLGFLHTAAMVEIIITMG